jgi:DNA repair photolyase
MSIIYKPQGKAGEYAALACNLYKGCDHGCTYCYAPNILHVEREQFIKPTIRNENLLDVLEQEAKALTPKEPILLCFTCDPYCHFDEKEKLTRGAIQILHHHGHRVDVLTKGGTRALRDLDLFGPLDSFGTTLTLWRGEAAKQWEPAAATPKERCDAIKEFHKKGVPTWMSLEPVLNPADTLDIIRGTHEYVDLYRVGKLNHHRLADAIDWRLFARQVADLLVSLGSKFVLKEELRTQYLR